MSNLDVQRLAKNNPNLKPWDIEAIIQKFNALDLDSNGGLDQRFLSKAVDSVEPGHSYDQVREALKGIEVSRPGIVELDEFVELISSMKSGPTSAPAKPGAGFEGIPNAKALNRRTIITSKQNESSAHTINQDEKEEFTNHINLTLDGDPNIGYRLPIDPTTMQIFDEYGLILSKLINHSAPDTIDERVLNKGKKLSPFQITENNNVVVNSAKAIGCSVVNIGSQDLAQGREHLILGLIWQIIKIGLFANIDIKLHPELYRLLEEDETLDDFLKLPAEAILLRWFNYHLKAAGWHRRVSNFSSDIKDSENYIVLLSQIAPEFCDRQALNISDLSERAESMLQNADRIECRRYVSPKTVVNGNPKLNLAFVALLFNTHPCLQALEETAEHAELDDYLFRDQYDRESRAFSLWLNSLNVNPFVNYLFEDIKDGRILLQAFNKIFPNSVIQRRANMQDNLSRFKQIENTNYAVELGKQHNFSLVGIQGADITDGTPLLVLAITWQLMRANIIQTLQSLSTHGKEITDLDMVKWANDTAASHSPRFSDFSIRTFNDSKLKSGTYLLDVLDGVKNGIVDPSLVTKGISEDDAKMNAKYAISIARKLGATIFLLPEDIVEVKPKMILTFIGSLMALQNL
ncbi:Fimbrin [Smittium mucronatum]|uniref:Fimbrin n=1 Tax=Smittium mucronatum TaxID=133383 RepID=A0A1R0H514_9FUNG|nr:Fimbrin [Smittium mucronatum]